MNPTAYEWYNSLKHGGMLIAPARLAGHFSEGIEPLPRRVIYELRKVLTRVASQTRVDGAEVLGTVLEEVCGLRGDWVRGARLGKDQSVRALSGETVRPRRVWRPGRGLSLPVFVDTEVSRLGIGRGRRSHSRVLEWLRARDGKVGLLTNLRQWRLVYAGIDFDAWVEWDIELWLEEGRESDQLTALRVLLSRESLEGPLLAAIQESRKGQAELSGELGERVRTAVETLIQARGEQLGKLSDDVAPSDMYMAATRVIMRIVVALFAEARDLLPRDNPMYHLSYSIGGLRESLERSGAGKGGERLRHRAGAWARVVALCNLVYRGSYHQALPVPRYGGNLFEPGDPASDDPVMRAVAVFEDTSHGPTDSAVLTILNLLCRSRVKVRQGNAFTRVETPVDFSDLSSEYIGILYEGLLDYELKRVRGNDPVVFLGLGNQPALDLAALEAMDAREVRNLVEKMKVKKEKVDIEDEVEDEERVEVDAEAEDDLSSSSEEDSDAAAHEVGTGEGTDILTDDDRRQAARDRALAWARDAVVSGKIVKVSRKKQASGAGGADVEKAAGSLIRRVVLPGEWYLVRWGGTRKGSGTFYTRPQLAVPTVHRTLRPLAFDPPVRTDGIPDEQAPAHEWKPKTPDAILGVKVCDPAMGSGSFPVAALRFLTDALYRSLHYHGRIRNDGERSVVGIVEGDNAEGSLTREYLPCLPDDDRFEELLRARLKRYVVERCIYGVDSDALAVELGRLALWIETMDRDLPFEFLDHKLKCGNSLVGCRLDRFRDYPVLAWKRKGGDGDKGPRTRAIAQRLRSRVIPELRDVITGQTSVFEPRGMPDPSAVHREALEAVRNMAAIPVHDSEARAVYYREHIQRNEHIAKLTQALDTWCSVWFWPVDDLDDAPMPRGLLAPTERQRETVRALKAGYRFFHWELEFPDVFTGEGIGFSAMIGNPPWETMQPVDKEYFSNVDPLYRTYGQQEAKTKQREYFERDSDLEQEYVAYKAFFNSFATWVKYSSSPWGNTDESAEKITLSRGKENDILHRTWSQQRARHGAGVNHRPSCFKHQGEGKPYTYKLFLELGYTKTQDDGSIGMLVPSGIYSDKGTGELRKLFLDKCRWKWLFSFENRQKIFDIHRSFKFCPVILGKGGTTDAILTAFMRHDITEWERAEAFVTPYPREQVEKFSPRSRSILEIRGTKDLEILDTIYSNALLLGDDGPDGWGIKYAQGDFNMTSDSRLFPPRPKWEAKGYKPDEYGRWIGPDGDVALPLYEGRMIGQFDFSQKGWVSGKGRSAVWREIPWEKKVIEPQYLVSEEDYRTLENKDGTLKCTHGLKTGFIDVSSATNQRTMISSLVPDLPCGNKVPILITGGASSAVPRQVALTVLSNGFVFDYAMRRRHGGLSLNWFIVEEAPLPPLDKLGTYSTCLLYCGLRLNAGYPRFWPYLLAVRNLLLKQKCPFGGREAERMRLRCITDVIVTLLYGVGQEEFGYILADCDYPVDFYTSKQDASQLHPKGFWRVDKDKPPELRHTVLSLVAFHDLQRMIEEHGGDRDKGIEAFCNQNNGEGWMLPEKLRLADYGLGHDDRAQQYQPVAEKFGPRFYDWQLEQTPEESWAECERHARNILGDEGFERLMAGEGGDGKVEVEAEEEQSKSGQKNAGPRYGEQLGFL